ncbi:hypothetical protein X975_15210, partial [Stegodyphus mimosarum]
MIIKTLDLFYTLAGTEIKRYEVEDVVEQSQYVESR